MSGARVLVGFGDRQAVAGLSRLRALGADTTPIMRAIGAKMAANVRDRLGGTTDPEGKPWPGLQPAYAALRGGSGMLRVSGERGGLSSTITFDASSRQVVVGSNKKYAAIHQFGGTITPKRGKFLVFRLGGARGIVRARKVTIPARPYLGFGPDDREAVTDTLDFFLSRAVRSL